MVRQSWALEPSERLLGELQFLNHYCNHGTAKGRNAPLAISNQYSSNSDESDGFFLFKIKENDDDDY